MKKTLALVLCLALPAFAADDAPALKCLEPSERVALDRVIVGKDARIVSLENSVKAQPSTALIVVLTVAGVLAGLAAGYGIARVTEKK